MHLCSVYFLVYVLYLQKKMSLRMVCELYLKKKYGIFITWIGNGFLGHPKHMKPKEETK